MAKKSKSAGLGLAGSMPRIDRAEQMRYRAEDDLRTLQRAEEVRKDSQRMRMAQMHAKSLVQVAKRGK